MSFVFQKVKGLINLIQKKPILAVFNVTRHCNQRCLMCHIPKISKELSIEEIKIFADKLQKFGIIEVYLQGGEPLLRKDIIEIVDVFIEKSIRPSIITNGELLTPKIAKEIAKRKCNLFISIDTFIPELYKKLRGNDALEKVLKNLICFKDLISKGVIAVTSTITNYSTKEDLQKIQDYCKKMGFAYYVRPYNYNLDKAGAKKEELICDNEKTIKLIEYFNNPNSCENVLFSIVYKENIEFLKGKRYNFCDAMKYTIVLNEDGKISPCIEHTDIKFDLDDYTKQRLNLKDFIKNCNKETPCIYGCTRNIGFLMKNKIKILGNILKIIKII